MALGYVRAHGIRLVDELAETARAQMVLRGNVRVLWLSASNEEELGRAAIEIAAASLLAGMALAALSTNVLWILACLGLPLLAALHLQRQAVELRHGLLSEDELPALIDALAAATQVGLPVLATLEQFARSRTGSTARVLEVGLARIQAGVPKEEALTEAAALTRCPRFEALVQLITQSGRSREGLSALFDQQAKEVWEDTRLSRRERAEQLPTKLFFPIFLCFFLPVVLLASVPFLSALSSLRP